MKVQYAIGPFTAFFVLAMAGFIVTPARADDKMRSAPKDKNSYHRFVIPEDLDPPKTVGKSKFNHCHSLMSSWLIRW
jgi:hypothetical protein